MIRHLIRLLDPRFRYRSAETGEFVSRTFALRNPKTTVRERVRPTR